MSQDKQLTDARVDQNLAEKDGEYEINLMELWYRVLENWKYVAGAAFAGMIAAIIVTFLFITPISRLVPTLPATIGKCSRPVR
jgi:LPS O-antigen subunit length determinant protein (WzzB/FepE family)